MLSHWYIAFIVLLSCISLNVPAQQNGNSKILWTAVWSDNGKYIAIGGYNNELLIYDGKYFNLLKKYPFEKGILRVAWHPYNNLLAIAAEGNDTRLINLDTEEQTLLNDSGGSRSIAWNDDGSRVASANYNSVIKIWDQEGQLLKRIEGVAEKSFLGIDWNGKEVVVVSDSIWLLNEGGAIIKKWKNRREDVAVLCVQWHPSGKFFVTGDYGHDDVKSLLQFWDQQGHLLKQNDISKAEHRNISWNRNGKKLASASDALRIWNKRGKLLYEGKSPDLLWGVDWSPDGKYIVTSSIEGRVIIWNRKANIVKQIEVP